MRIYKMLLLMIGMAGLILCWQPPVVNALDIDTSSRFTPVENQRVISMDFENASLPDVLKIFSQQSGMNFIADTSVSGGSINLYLDKVPVEEALERILSANNLTYELRPESNIFVVKPLVKPDVELMTRKYQLKYASVSSSKVFSTLSGLTDSESGGGSTNSQGIINALTNILTQNGSIVEDPRTNSIVVTDVPSQFNAIERLIQKMDVKVPLILIEAEMLDISKGTSEKLGAKWGDTPLVFSGASRTGIWPFDTTKFLDKGGIITSDGGTFDESSPGGKQERFTTSTFDFSGLSFTLQFLRGQSDTKNLARPRILTLNNETALIQITTEEAIGSSTGTSSDETATVEPSEAERVQTGVFLTVTPQANLQTGEILMAVEPKVVTTKLGKVLDPNTNEFYRDPEERSTKSILRVSDGDTILIGGLLQNEDLTSRTGVPILKDIPILGRGFRHRDSQGSERELVVFITPSIVRDDYKMQPTNLSSNRNMIREQHLSSKKYRAVERELSTLKQ